MRNRLLNLLASNAGQGAKLQAADNTIWIYDFIVGSESDAQWWGGVSAESVAKALRTMSGPVAVRIDSPGGDVFGGRAMAQAIREYPDGVTVHIDGLAASIASIIAIAGSKIIAAPGSMMMIHKAWTMAIGNSEELITTAALLEKIDGTLADSYATKAGGDAADWLTAMKAETWYTADEAIAAGLIDELAPARGAGTAEAHWNLSAFNNPPAQALARAAIATPPANDTVAIDEIASRQRRLAADLRRRAA